MSKNKQLNEVFEEIIRAYKEKNMFKPDDIPIFDGIIKEECFAKQTERILIICKEHNTLKEGQEEIHNNDEGKNGGNDFRVWWNQGVTYRFAHNIASWTIAVLNKFKTNPEDFTYTNKEKALKKIAFINIKKTSGGSSISYKTLQEFIEIGKDDINKQIDIIDPTLIICCLNNDYLTQKLLHLEKIVLEDSNSFSIGYRKEAKVINFYHPSARKSMDDFLKLLQNTLAKFDD